VEGLAFGLEQSVLMSRVRYKLLPVVRALVTGDLRSAIQDPHHRIGGRQGQNV
jgi:hypothetical protein